MSWINWLTSSFEQLWSYFWSGRTFAVVLGVAFAFVAVALLIASRTRWGQSKPLTKCVVLSVLAHVWLIMYALGTQLVLPQGDPRGSQHTLRVSLQGSMIELPLEDSTPKAHAEEQEEFKPWEEFVPAANLPAPPLVTSKLAPLETIGSFERIDAPSLLEPVRKPETKTADEFVDAQKPELVESNSPTADETSLASEVDRSNLVSPPIYPHVALDSNLASSSQAGTESPKALDAESTGFRPISSSASSSILPPEKRLPQQTQTPIDYRMRKAPNRLELAMPYGADHDSEAAVEAGLNFLASAQSADGAWNAKRFGGGTETRALGEHRHNTGDRADTGVSGLALLAFLSGGHTHLEGKFKNIVRNGLEFLLRAQMPSGDLSGPKQIGNDPSVTNAKMYCHGIATLALAEAYAMTRDAALREPLTRAAQFTINAQDVRGGGWRYRTGDPGDLSQFGWQAMALRSVERSGIQLPREVNQRMQRFIDSCAAGRAGGLARYRPGEGVASSTMTAESLACRFLMDYPLSAAAQIEAEQMLMQNLPGTGEENVYYWYYATLALFQLQDNSWRTWNQALKAHLLKTQKIAFTTDAGSWNPDQLWGGYGGRIYSTAMSCLCLEVYYRYLPMYQRSNLARTTQPSASR